jgi:hypothetical protein
MPLSIFVLGVARVIGAAATVLVIKSRPAVYAVGRGAYTALIGRATQAAASVHALAGHARYHGLWRLNAHPRPSLE